VAYRRAIDVDPGLAVAYNNLGVALESLGRVDDAIAAYTAGTRLLPDEPQAHFNLAAVLAANGRAAEAIPHLETVVRLRPDAADAHAALAAACAAAGRFPDAVAAGERAYALALAGGRDDLRDDRARPSRGVPRGTAGAVRRAPHGAIVVGHAELALLDGRRRLRSETVVHEDVAADVLRLPGRALHLVADEVRVGVLHALAVLVDRVAEVLRLPESKSFGGALNWSATVACTPFGNFGVPDVTLIL
jgi:tetratricopeptide (TPR) repeat protein